MSRTAVSPAVWVLARGLLRSRRRASVGLALLAGLAAAVPMAVWAAGRQAATAVERTLQESRAAEALVTVCPPGLDPDTEGDPAECVEYQPERELPLIRSLPGVTEAARVHFTFVRIGPSPDPGTWRPRSVFSLADPAASPTMLGEPEVISGRLAAENAPDELMVNEATARAFGLRPGDRVWMQGGEQAGSVDGDAPTVASTVVGIVRTVADLLPLGADALGVPPFYARAGWSRTHGHQLPPEATQVMVGLEDGDIEGFEARLQARLGHQLVDVSTAVDSEERSNLDQATAFESRAALVLAALAGLAVAFFLGQGVSRQSRAESSDVPTLLVLGMTRRQLVVAGAARWLPISLAGGAVAMGAALAASALGPIGLARRAPWEPGPRADPLVLALGGAATAAFILLSGALTLSTSRRAPAPDAGPAGAAGPLGSPGVRAGVALARRSLARGSALPVVSALVGASLAVAAVIATTGASASLHRVTASSARFGAPWDALVGGDPVLERQEAMLAELAALPGISAAAAIPGSTVALGGRELWIQTLVPIEGIEPMRPVITAGREPMADNEIALGSVTMRELGLDLGDEVTLQSQVLETEPPPYRVVGVTMITDGYEPNVGKGGLVSLGGLGLIAPEYASYADTDIVVRVVAGAGRASALAALQEAFPHAIVPFPLPSSLANAERIAGLPKLLGVVAAAMAAITLTHALVVSVRRNRRELAVCRVLGFTRAQVYGAVATQATLIGLAAAAAGVLLGVIGARSGWRMLADSFGVASGPIVPVGVALLSVVAVLLVANLAAAASGRRAAHLRTADVLRTE